MNGEVVGKVSCEEKCKNVVNETLLVGSLYKQPDHYIE
jgi:hypothetical protein